MFDNKNIRVKINPKDKDKLEDRSGDFSSKERCKNKTKCGRPRKLEKDKKTERVSAYCTPDEKEKFDAYCRELSSTKSEVIKRYIIDCIKKWDF